MSTLPVGNWLRHERYTLHGGAIVPARRAKAVVYDPWALERKVRPHFEFVALGRMVADPKATLVADKRPEVLASIEAFAQRFGLLGLISHRVKQVVLPPRWRRSVLAGRGGLVAEQRTFVQTPLYWQTVARTAVACTISDRSRRDTCLTASEGAELWPGSPRPEATVVPIIGSGGPEREELNTTWGEYFPTVAFHERDDFDYPQPMATGFWQLYGEPVADIAATARAFASAVSAVLDPATDTMSATGMAHLAQLASCGVLHLVPRDDGALEQRWSCRSLLSAMALMAMEELAGSKIHQCKNCGTTFYSVSPHAEYCRPRCAMASRKRAHRRALRERARARQRRPKARR